MQMRFVSSRQPPPAQPPPPPTTTNVKAPAADLRLSRFEPRPIVAAMKRNGGGQSSSSSLSKDKSNQNGQTSLKVVCTMGPATASERVLERLVLGGMTVARLNFSHGSAEEHVDRARLVRQVAERCGRHVALLASRHRFWLSLDWWSASLMDFLLELPEILIRADSIGFYCPLSCVDPCQ